jgi:adhesin/invasin
VFASLKLAVESSRWRTLAAGSIAVAGLALYSGCGGDGGPTEPPAQRIPSSIQPASSQTQTATVGTAVGARPAVTVRDQTGSPMAGVTVNFAVQSGGGTLTDQSQTTDGSGKATVGSWTLGTVAGENRVVASGGGIQATVAFVATGVAGPATTVAVNGGNNQFAPAGATLATSPSVRVTDEYGNPVSGVTVTFAVGTGGGSTTGASQQTNSAGIASVGSWTLGADPGPNTLTASASGLSGSPLTFTATGSTVPTKIELSGGDGQAVAVASAVPIRPAVKITDADGQPVGGVEVTFAIASGGGTLVGASQLTSGEGIAAVESWVLGTTLGTNTLTAASGGLSGSPVTFTATAVAGSPSSIVLHAGNNQSTGVGSAVAVAPAVRVFDAFGNPVAGVPVTFAAIETGSSVIGVDQLTDAAGIATAGSWVLGTSPGFYTLQATSAGLSGSPVIFTAAATIGTATAIAAHAGNGQTAAVGTSVQTPPAVRVTDALGNPVRGVPVNFVVVTGGGSVTGGLQTTDALGIASVGGWTLGPAPGPNTLTATSGTLSGSPVTFSATAVSGQAGTMTIAAGNDQTVTVGTEVPIRPAVQVTDGFGNPVSGVHVSFAVAEGGGSITGADQTTDAQGVAAVGSWTVGTELGLHTLVANSPGLIGSPATFTATVVAGAAARIAINGGDNQTAAAGTAVSIAPSVKVTDAFGNPVAGTAVTFSVTSGGGSATGANQTTNAQGIATVGSWTLGMVAGSNTLQATSAGLTGSPVQFTATAAAADAGSVALNAGNNQATVVGTAVPVAPSVRVTDSFGNPVAGTAVTFAVTGGGGSVTGANQTTNAQGIATVGSWTLGTATGSNTLQASSPGLLGSPVTFTATAIAAGAANIALNAGNSQTAVVGTAVPVPPSVKVTDSFGNPVAGTPVTFLVTGGGGSVTGANPTTNAQGIATVGSWTLGTVAGPNTLQATSPGLVGSPVTFTAQAVVGPAANIAIDTGNNQTAAVGTALPVAPSVMVTDAFGNPVAGRAVTFAVTSGGGSVTGASQSTNAQGIATVGSWTLGPATGANTLTATSAGLTGSPLTFTATAVAGNAGSIVLDAGSNQTATVGTAVGVRPSVKVTDTFGNPVAGTAVTFAVTGGGGSITGANQTTNAQGIATVGSWTLGTATGSNTLQASSAGLIGSPIQFSAMAVAGAAANIAVNGGNNQTASVGTAVPVAPSVRITDSFGNPVAGTAVTFSVFSGGGTITGASQTTNAQGIATVTSWTLGPATGAQTLRATSAGLSGSPVTFNATAVAGAAANIAINAGNNQSATVGTAVSVAPSVRVTDSFGNPVSGTAVSFSVTGGGGSITGASQTTNPQGIATVGGWTLGTVAGSNTLSATSVGLSGSPVTFTAAGTAGAATTLALQAGNNQTVPIGTSVAIAPSVKVTDSFGNGVAARSVTFAVTGGGGSITGGSQTTDAQGMATVGSWTLGTSLGSNTLQATSAGLTGSPVTFSATAVAGAPAIVTIDAGNNQTVAVNTNASVRPAVKITDAQGNPVSGVSVTFSVGTGGGSVTGPNQVTNAQGIATVGNWRMGTTSGSNTLIAAPSALVSAPLTVFATAVPGPARAIALNAGNNQTAAVGGQVSVPPSVRVADAFGNPVTGVNVTFAVTGGGGSLSGATQPTNANGIAAVGAWTLGTATGTNTMTATVTVSGFTGSVPFSATAVSGVATSLAINSGNNQSATVGSAVGTAPEVRVTDTFGNPVGGIAVAFVIASGGGTITGANQTTNAQGIATVGGWTLGSVPGTNTLRASAGNLSSSPVTFTATGQTGPAALIVVNAGNSQTASVGSAVSVPPSVRVTDVLGNPVANVTVTFAVAGGDGSLTGALQNTGANGVATVGSWTLGESPGNNVLHATSAGLSGSPVTFSATAVNGSASTIAINGGNNQTGAVLSVLPAQASVKVADAFGNGVPNVAVTFRDAGGGGGVNGLEETTVSTNAQGIAAVTWTLGFAAGTQMIEASGPALAGSPLTFTAIATAGAASRIQLNAGNNQTAAVGAPVAIAPSVRVTDQFGNPVSNSPVTFAVSAGNGVLSGANPTTNAQGIASVGSWTLGMTPGLMTLTATSAGLTGSPVTINAVAQLAGATTIALDAGNNQTVQTGFAVPVRPSVRVTDADGNPVPGVTVTFAIASGGGILSGANQVTDGSGVATVSAWALGMQPGTNTLRASATGLTGSPVTFTATGFQVVSSIEAATTTSQSATAGTQVTSPPAVRVRDHNGVVVQGTTVSFAVTSGGGAISHASVVTNSMGTAGLTSWTLGAVPGPNSVSATVSGLAPVTFSATGLNPCTSLTNLAFGASINEQLTNASCQLLSGEYAKFYSFTLAAQTAVTISMASGSFDTYLLLVKQNADLVGENDDSETLVTGSEISAILAPGTYRLVATTFAPGETGAFTLTFQQRSQSAANCEEMFVSRAITSTQDLSATDCPGDLFGLFLKAGENVTIQMNSGGVDSYLRLLDEGGNVVRENDNRTSGTLDAQITYTATEAGYVFIHTTSSSGADIGPYTLVIN